MRSTTQTNFSGSRIAASKQYLRGLLKTTLWRTTGVLLAYDNITLAKYLEVAASGNLGLLVVKGKFGNKELVAAWEAIVKRNADANEDSNYDLYLDNLKAYGEFVAEFNLVKAMLTQLCFEVDDDRIADLSELGYKIRKTKYVDGKEVESATAYQESIQAAQRKSENLITKINSKFKELQLASKASSVEAPTLGALLAQVSFGLGFNLPVDVTLSQFNEYKKLVKQKYDEQRNRKAERNNR